jgi:hypothetical protein
MEPGVARVAVAVNMYQTGAPRNLKTLVHENPYYQLKRKNDQPLDPNLNSKLHAKRKLVNDKRSPNCPN